MRTPSKHLILTTFAVALVTASCGGSSSSDSDRAETTVRSSGSGTAAGELEDDASEPADEGSGDDGSGIDESGGSAAAVAIRSSVDSLPTDDSGMAQATEIFNDAGLDFNAAALEAGFGSDHGEIDDSSRCLEVNAAAVGEILGVNLGHHPEPNEAPDQTRQPHLRCKLVDLDSDSLFPVVEFFLSPVLGLDNPDPDGLSKKWDAGGAFDDFVAVDGLGNYAEWMAEQTNMPDRSVLYVEAGGGSAMIIGQVRNGVDSTPMNGPPLIFALAEITSAF